MRFLSKIRVNPDRIGDALGAIAVIGLVVAGFWIAHGIGFPTGGDELMGVV